MRNSDRGRLANEILRYSRQTLLKQWPWLGPLLFRLQLRSLDEVHIMGSNGEYLFYNADDVIALYKEDPAQIPKMMLHVLGHCMMQHVERRNGREHDLYDTACDLSVFQLISRLPGGKSFAASAQERTEVNQIFGGRDYASAESLYTSGMKDAELKGKFDSVRNHVHRDDHTFWGKKMDLQENGPGMGSAFSWKQAMMQAVEEYQKAMSEMGRFAGQGRGDWTEMLELDRDEEVISYEELLKRFTAPVETMRLDMDSLDLAWYVTGLDLYGDLPIVEYNEYRDMNLVETFVIAIDTSGSCYGPTLKNFLAQTKKVVEDMEIGGRKFLLRMMQCDYDIQEEVEIRTLEEFNEYIERFRVRGGGGTSFVPIFRKVDQLVAEEEGYSKLKGFLYFSDGFGEFPNRASAYETVFVIPEDDFQYHPQIPDWVTVACLKEESLDLI
ncbi:MAG: hypothetical protein J6S45_07190 [Firmicutes bacterium]|nr:hypothetical protein [Bacillota bacterium]